MQAGQTIAGKYRLNRLLGTGGMASVWSATNVFTEREFAVKFMLPQVARTPEAARRFLLEAKVSARINHPNIIEVIDVGQAEDGSLFLVMELLTGVSLDVATRRQTPAMTLHEFLGHMKDVAVALAAAHRSGVIHRDLKPTNVFLHKDRDGRVVPKLLDFGVSKILEEENNTSLTVVGTVLGSPLYMSPEQAMGAAGIDGRTDIFAFGGILFEAMTGQRAYDAPNFNALIVTIATKEPKKIDDAAPQLPESIRALVRECMVTDKTKRLASFDAIVERLDTTIKEVENLPMRLPSPYGEGERPSDPDATNALPMVGRSDRDAATKSVPPQSGGQRPSARPPTPAKGLAAAQGNGEPQAWTQSANRGVEAAIAWLRHLDRFYRELPPKTRALGAAGAGVVVVLLIVGVTMALSGGGTTSRAAIQGSTVAATTGVTPPAGSALAVQPEPTHPTQPPSADDSSNVPTISVDSLPVVGRGAPAKGNGRLSIVASPGWCSVSVDGTQRGVTPLTGFDVPAGSHRVDCTPPSGKSRTATVSVAEGTATHYRFALDE
ncbi:MAG TPA: serine/threonine-protein kinase [Polyangiaceae bacterium]